MERDGAGWRGMVRDGKGVKAEEEKKEATLCGIDLKKICTKAINISNNKA